MKIGDKTYAVKRPDDLETQLAETTAQGVEEVRRSMTGGSPIASQIAGALRPCLPKDAPSVPELASAIAGDDIGRIQGEVAKLYAEPAPSKASANG